jgi:predicted nucleotidyltransferase
MVYSRDEASGIARAFLARIADRYRVQRAFLFGSTVWGAPGRYSDIDLAVVIEPRAGDVEGVWDDDAFEIFHAAQEYNSALEVLCLSQEEFEDDGVTVVHRIKEQGVELDVRGELLEPQPT